MARGIPYAALRRRNASERSWQARQTLVEVNRRPGSQQGSTENLILQY